MIRQLILATTVLAAGTASAQQRGVMQATCNIEGMPAQFTAQYEVIGGTGIVTGSGPDAPITGVIGTGGGNVYYQGTLVSQTARYVFTGENQFADFTNPDNYERFRVQFQVQGSQMLMTVNPFGPGPVQYLCQITSY